MVRGASIPWIPTPLKVVKRALSEAWVGSCDIVYDLGAGDGRVVVLAVSEFKAMKAVGIEINPVLAEVIRIKAREKGVADKVVVVEDDFMKVGIGEATVVYTYLYKSVNELLRSKFENELSDGARVVTIDFPVPGWIPVKVRRLLDEAGIVRSIYVYVKGVSDNQASNKPLDWSTRALEALLGKCHNRA
ncbi:MAG: class I SAM-dependent methyltransferase [Pyrodictiaceae archaeon]